MEYPEAAAKGSEIIIRVIAIHNANSFLHHVEWLWIQGNDIEISRWDYSATNRPGSSICQRKQGQIRQKGGDIF